MAINSALGKVKETGDLPVPLHLRNAPTSLMSDLGYGAGYKYAHDYSGNYVEQQYLPDEIKNTSFWNPGQNPHEAQMKLRQDERKNQGKGK